MRGAQACDCAVACMPDGPERWLLRLARDAAGLDSAQVAAHALCTGAEGLPSCRGIPGKINKPLGFDKLAEGTESWDGKRENSRVRSRRACLIVLRIGPAYLAAVGVQAGHIGGSSVCTAAGTG